MSDPDTNGSDNGRSRRDVDAAAWRERLPFGYRRDAAGGIELDPDQARSIDEAYRRYGSAGPPQ